MQKGIAFPATRVYVVRREVQLVVKKMRCIHILPMFFYPTTEATRRLVSSSHKFREYFPDLSTQRLDFLCYLFFCLLFSFHLIRKTQIGPFLLVSGVMRTTTLSAPFVQISQSGAFWGQPVKYSTLVFVQFRFIQFFAFKLLIFALLTSICPPMLVN